MTTIQEIQNFISEQVIAFNEGDNYTEVEKYGVNQRGVTYKNALVIQINFVEGTIFSRLQFGSNKADVIFLRQLVRDLPAILEKPKEII
jgi:hypothetical protein